MIDTGFAFNLFHYTDHEILNAIILIDLHFQTHGYNETKVIIKRNTGLLRSETKSFKILLDDLLVKLANSDVKENDSFVSLSGNIQCKLINVYNYGGCTDYSIYLENTKSHFRTVINKSSTVNIVA